MQKKVVTDEKFQRQLNLELEMSMRGRRKVERIYAKAKSDKNESITLYGQSLMRTQLNAVSSSIDSFMAEAESGKAGRRHTALKYLKLIDDSRVTAFITLRTIVNSLSSRVSLSSLALKLAGAIYEEHKLSEFERLNPDLFNLMHSIVKTNHEQHKANALNIAMKRAGIGVETWSKQDKVQLGVKLIEIFMDATGFIEISGESNLKGTVTNYVVPTEKCLEFIKRTEDFAGATPEYLPTIIPPKLWSDVFDGGYYAKTKELWLVKARFSPKAYLEELNNRVDEMQTVYNAVNAIQNTSWRINKRVFDVMSHLWKKQSIMPDKKGGYITDEDMPLPVCPVCNGVVEETGDHKCFNVGENKEAFKSWKKKVTQTHKNNIARRSKRLTVARIISVAKEFLNEEEIYFPYQLDFRGRVYAVPSFLNPQSQDWGKGLLEFAEAKPIIEWGAVRWLAIHGANVYGEDKLSLDERFSWVISNDDIIRAVADNPIENTFWHKADKPFQFLAFCFEWADYKAACERGVHFNSRLPIAMDGTCNGLQIYSLLLRDEEGGKATNIIPSSVPSDIYGVVASKVVEKLKLKIQAGQKRFSSTGALLYDEKIIAPALIDLGIDRSCTKRQVMTVPYAATFESCKQYTYEWLREAAAKHKDNVINEIYPDSKSLFYPALFLAETIWQAVGETVIKAYEGMGYLQSIASIIAKDSLPIYWTSPVGFKVMQAYKEEKSIEVKTRLGGKLKVFVNDELPKISSKKQRMGIAPNFIHSLDAAAMMKTVDKASRQGITHFAMIHDSYGTHAADSTKLASILREAFVEMFSSDVLETWTNEVLEIVPESKRNKMKLPQAVEYGSLNLTDLLESEYFFA